MRDYQLIIGLTTEGKSDDKFLKDIISRTFNSIVSECQRSVEIINTVCIPKTFDLPYIEEIHTASNKAYHTGVSILCVHQDADDHTNTNKLNNKINPAFSAVKASDGELCKCLVPVIPIYETEAWMLADKELLKNEIGTNLSDNDLQINIDPEDCADPKETIRNAIRIARQNIVKRRRKEITIQDLYTSMGDGVDLSILGRLSSYTHFTQSVRDALRDINLLS